MAALKRSLDKPGAAKAEDKAPAKKPAARKPAAKKAAEPEETPAPKRARAAKRA